MAKATNSTVTIVKQEIALYLDEKEALALADVLGNIAGDRQNSRRKYTNSIAMALREANVNTTSELTGFEPRDIDGIISFEIDKDA